MKVKFTDNFSNPHSQEDKDEVVRRAQEARALREVSMKEWKNERITKEWKNERNNRAEWFLNGRPRTFQLQRKREAAALLLQKRIRRHLTRCAKVDVILRFFFFLIHSFH